MLEKFCTCPSALIGHDEGSALGVALTNANGLIDTVDRQHASVVPIRRPAAVVLPWYRHIIDLFIF